MGGHKWIKGFGSMVQYRQHVSNDIARRLDIDLELCIGALEFQRLAHQHLACAGQLTLKRYGRALGIWGGQIFFFEHRSNQVDKANQTIIIRVHLSGIFYGGTFQD